jgi:DNA replication protein DnaC
VEDTVTSIVTYRCNNRKPLIATSNLPDPEAGGAIMERRARWRKGGLQGDAGRAHRGARAAMLFEMCKVIRMPLVEDFRLRKAQTW